MSCAGLGLATDALAQKSGWFTKPGAPTTKTLTFGGMQVISANNSFGTYSTGNSFAFGAYLAVFSQSGEYTLNNLQLGVNGTAVGSGGTAIMNSSTEFHLSGVVPAGTAAGKVTTVTLSIFTMGGSLAAKGTVQVQVAGSTPDWTLEWKRTTANDPLGEQYLYIGDFDGDGVDEILAASGATGTADWMNVYKYVAGAWTTIWSNNGNPNAGNGIYPYRGAMTVGDFDGDGKDEVLGTGGWITMFHFDNGNWQWGWSNYGSTTAGHGIYPYKDHLVAGDFNGDGKDELLGNGGWITMFEYTNNDFWWGWSNYGSSTAGSGLGAYPLARFYPGDLDGDGDDELIALGGWGTTFDFESGNFQWNFSTYGSNSFGGWGYPMPSTDQLIVGNVDYPEKKEELLFFQTGNGAKWATSMEVVNGVPTWRWSTLGTNPFIGSFPVMSLGGIQTEYRLVKALANKPSLLLCRRRYGPWRETQMYRIANTILNF